MAPRTSEICQFKVGHIWAVTWIYIGLRDNRPNEPCLRGHISTLPGEPLTSLGLMHTPAIGITRSSYKAPAPNQL